jgi:hypothetical protein
LYTGKGQSTRGRHDKTVELLRKQASPAKLEEYLRLRGDQGDDETLPMVLSCNWNTVAVFLMLSSDWTRAGMVGAFVGIPSPAIESTLRLSGISLGPEEFEDLKVMEAIAKPILNDALRSN